MYPVAAARGRTSIQHNGLKRNLIAYWPLNEAGGANNALDLHTNALTLTQTGSPTATTGKVYSTARVLNGTAKYFTRASESLVQIGGQDWTIAAWVYLTSTTANSFIASKDNQASQREFQFGYLGTGTLLFYIYVYNGGDLGVQAATFGAPTINTWYLVTAWMSTGGNLSISVNNGTADTASAGTVTSGTTAFYLGRLMTSYCSARLGPVALWKSASGGGGVLSATQRAHLYNGGNGLPYADFTT